MTEIETVLVHHGCRTTTTLSYRLNDGETNHDDKGEINVRD
jgi:hypothetical protein